MRARVFLGGYLGAVKELKAHDDHNVDIFEALEVKKRERERQVDLS